jgi:hypothetical protein
MAADRSYGEFYVFYVSPEYFGYILALTKGSVSFWHCLYGVYCADFSILFHTHIT